MKINLNAEIKTLNGKEVPTDTGDKLTLKVVCRNALLADLRVDPIEKFSRFKIAYKVEEGGEQEFSVDDVKKMKDCIGEVFPPLIMGQAWRLLDSKCELELENSNASNNGHSGKP